MENIIEVKNITKVYANQMALEEVNFSIRKGEIFGFLGPSGSGKTTMIKILTGQLLPTSGTAIIFGTDLNQLKKPEYRQRFGVLTDNNGLYSRLSIYENLKLYCQLYDVALGRIDEVLDSVNLKSEKTKKISALSKGMTQRVMLARALLHAPDLLFLDEPTSALDPVNTRHIYKGLQELNAKGTTIFLTTHDMEEADLLCNRVAFLNKGQIQLLGEPDRLKKDHSDSTVTVELVSEEKVVLPSGVDGAEKLYEYMKTNQIVTIHSNEPSLGDIFVQMTGRVLA
ncbi:ABC transporter ATP-binding protein [Planococcus sp. YIM B11945]|uniref:ABC transporter ATP-binding protein n=1 Tax=Planococcus sp. YIM B11945 TaxID=3435410 RepID=UPI003D7E8890